MNIVTIPFTPDMAQLSLEGRKTATSRTKRYGKPGDTFYIGDVLFEITGILRLVLGMVALYYHKAEGFDSPEAFKAKWEKLHPRKGFVPAQKVWFHAYRRAE